MKVFGKSLLVLLTVSLFFTMCKKENVQVEPQSIKLNKTTLSLTIDESAKLEAEISPKETTNKTISWESNAPAIASVENGVVVAKAQGEATISAKCGKVTATCVVTVKAQTVPVESITLDKTSVEMKEGEQLKLTATVAPSDAPQTVTWTSSNPTVASVVDGNITALKVGKTTVTAEAGGKQAQCEVTVREKFEFKMSVSNLSALDGEFKVEPSDPNKTYVYTILRKSMCDEIEARYNNDLIAADLDFWKEFGDQSFLGSLVRGTQTGKLSDAVTSDMVLFPDTEYVFYCFGINDKKEVTAPVEKYIFKSKPSVPSDLKFEFELEKITQHALVGTLKPSNTDSYYITMQPKKFVDHYKKKEGQGETIEGLSPIHYMIFRCIAADRREEKQLDDLILKGNFKLEEGYFVNKKPNSDYVLIAIGFDKEKGITTAPFFYEFKTAQ